MYGCRMIKEMTFDDAMEKCYKIMLDEWTKEELVEYIRQRDKTSKEVVHAYWIHTHTQNSYFTECYKCSACGYEDEIMMGANKYCAECGARMDASPEFMPQVLGEKKAAETHVSVFCQNQRCMHLKRMERRLRNGRTY